MHENWFKDWFNTPYYHQLYVNRDEQEAALFIDALIQFLQPKAGSRMLDIACGKGRHSLQLHKKGFEVMGIDLSLESIKSAQQFATDDLQFFTHDMRLPFHVNYFNYAFNFFTSFGYFDTLHEHEKAIRTFATSLKPKGILVIDYINAVVAEHRLEVYAEHFYTDVLFKISKKVDGMHFYKSIEVHDPKLNEPLHFVEKVAKFGLADFEKMLLLSGLKVKHVFGNYQLEPFVAESAQRLIIVAEKS